jgi:protein-tyrosine phosphatase
MQYPMTDAQRRRLERFGAAACVDIHCHCLPGLDDGPPTPEAALDLCRALVADGITVVVATPHQFGRYDRRNAGPLVRQAVETLRGVLAAEKVPLEVYPGADVRVDERLVPMLAAGEVLSLAGGPYLLLELPHETYIEPAPLIRLLAQRGVRTIITHPERHDAVRRKPQLVGPWLAAGAMLQLTAGSLIGSFGPRAEEAAWKWLSAGSASFVATDAHDVKQRPPCMTEAIAAIEKRLGLEVARLVCVNNPATVLQPAAAAPPPGAGSTSAAGTPSPRRRWGSNNTGPTEVTREA